MCRPFNCEDLNQKQVYLEVRVGQFLRISFSKAVDLQAYYLIYEKIVLILHWNPGYPNFDMKKAYLTKSLLR